MKMIPEYKGRGVIVTRENVEQIAAFSDYTVEQLTKAIENAEAIGSYPQVWFVEPVSLEQFTMRWLDG